jgi:hypothetical protein
MQNLMPVNLNFGGDDSSSGISLSLRLAWLLFSAYHLKNKQGQVSKNHKKTENFEI